MGRSNHVPKETFKQKKESYLYFFSSNKILIIGLLAAIGIVFFILRYDLTQIQRLPGVTETKAFVVNFKEPVIVSKIFVQSGQVVSKGAPLFELTQSEIDSLGYQNRSKLEQSMVEMSILYEKQQKAKAWFDELKVKEQKSEASLSPLEMTFLSLYEEKLVLESKKKKLKVVSPIDGYAGELLVSVGETIAPYRTLINIFQIKPTIVKSYIPESFNLIGVNKNRSTVVRSSSRNYFIKGDIISIGSILTELPPRFQKDPTNKIYGREIKINLPSQNQFYLGERVLVSLEEP